MKVSMDGMRRSATAAMNELADTLTGAEEMLPRCQFELLTEAFNEAAQAVDLFNCVFSKDDELFNDLSDEIEIKRLGEDDE